MIINSYRFATADTGVPLPTHWWDLDDDGVWAGQGTKDGDAGWTNGLNEGGTPSTTTSTIGSGGSRTVLTKAAAAYLEFDNAGTKTVAWDGDNDLISVSAWVYADAIATTGNWLVSMRESSTNRLFDLAIFNTDTPFFNVWDTDDDLGQAYDAAANNISTATWYHIVGTYDGTDVKYYLDGSLVSSATATPSPALNAFSSTALPFAIGAGAWTKGTANNGHDGLMHAVGIWDVGLSADDVTTLYNSGNGGSYSEIWT